jgi:hypothetical protein
MCAPSLSPLGDCIAGCRPLIAPHFNLTIELPLKTIVRGYTWTTIPITWRNRRTGEPKLKLKEMGSLFICLYIWLEKYFSRGDYRKPALITGITGQGRFLLSRVASVQRLSGTWCETAVVFLRYRPDRSPLYGRPPTDTRLLLHFVDLNDGSSLAGLLADFRPDEIL